jgi:uncharacterized membrane protein YeiH
MSGQPALYWSVHNKCTALINSGVELVMVIRDAVGVGVFFGGGIPTALNHSQTSHTSSRCTHLIEHAALEQELSEQRLLL